MLVTSHQAYFTHTAVGQIIEATLRNVDDFAAGRTNENTLVPRPWRGSVRYGAVSGTAREHVRERSSGAGERG